MNILQEDKDGKWILTEEAPINWMHPRPMVENCPFCKNNLWLRSGIENKGCTECGAQLKLKIGDLL